MRPEIFFREVALPVSVAEAFAWHSRPGALERLLPPWADVQVVSRVVVLEDEARVKLSVPLGPLRREWLAEYREVDPPRQFRDVSLHGPFPLWDHLHRFEPRGQAECVLVDRIEYACPGGLLGHIFGGGHVRRQLDRMFRYRHDTTVADLAMHAQYADRPRMKVAITGASGLIGSMLRHLLTTGGHQVIALRRDASNRIDAAPADGTDAVVHLAGESIAARRWSAQQKQKILNSRVQVTGRLCDDLLKLANPPRTLLAASAVGFYGSRSDERLYETSARGDGFLSKVCVAWEEAAQAVCSADLRVAALRFGVVLSPRGSALRLMLPVFRLGAGGRIGRGDQIMSWITLDDAVSAIHHVLMTGGMSGPVNMVAPEPISNAEFTRTLARVLGRPSLMPVPAMAAKAALGEMAESLLLSSQRVLPGVLEDTGFAFRHRDLETGLRHLLGRSASPAT